MTVLCVLFAVVLFFWAIQRLLGVKKRPDSVFDYVVGASVRRLFIPYYVLSVSTEDDVIMKYGVFPMAFNKLKKGIENAINL